MTIQKIRLIGSIEIVLVSGERGGLTGRGRHLMRCLLDQLTASAENEDKQGGFDEREVLKGGTGTCFDVKTTTTYNLEAAPSNSGDHSV